MLTAKNLKLIGLILLLIFPFFLNELYRAYRNNETINNICENNNNAQIQDIYNYAIKLGAYAKVYNDELNSYIGIKKSSTIYSSYCYIYFEKNKIKIFRFNSFN